MSAYKRELHLQFPSNLSLEMPSIASGTKIFLKSKSNYYITVFIPFIYIHLLLYHGFNTTYETRGLLLIEVVIMKWS